MVCIFATMMLPQSSSSASEDEDVVAQRLSAIGGGHLTINKGGRPLPHLCSLFLRQGRQRGNNDKDNNGNDNTLTSKSSTIFMLRGEGRNGHCLIAVVVICGSNGGAQRALLVEGRGELPSLSAAIATTTKLLTT
jgi:hypothetical protein